MRHFQLLGRYAGRVLCGLILCTTALQAANASPRAIEFWVVEPNEGQSAGGHAAIRIGEWLYHVEHRGDGLIADRRTPRSHFEETYRERGNRSISVIPLDFEASAALLLEERLETRYFSRRRELDQLDQLESNERFLARAHERGFIGVDVPGLGLFDPESSSCASRPDAIATIAHDLIRARYGRGWLESRRTNARQETRSRLGRLLGSNADQIRTVQSDGPGGSFRRLASATQAWAAFDVLADCRSIRADRIQPADGSAERPSESGSSEEIAHWAASRERHLVRLVELVASDREDLGLPLLLAVARLEALHRSIETGRLHILDPFEEAVSNNPASASLEAGLPEEWIHRLEEQAERRWRSVRIDFAFGKGPLEARMAMLERAHHDLQHMRSRSLHLTHPSTSLSEVIASITRRYAAAERVLPWPRDVALTSLESMIEITSTRVNIRRKTMARALRYRLFTRNCVSELLAVLDPEDAKTPLEAFRSSKRTKLLDLLRGLFIPVVAGRFVEATHATRPRRTLESARDQILRQAPERGFALALLEATTLTTRTYRPHSADSSFLFFSDGPVWARPLLGASNLVYALAAAGLGIFEAPFDRGEQFRRGLQGALMSVPELFFFQVRQGSYPVSPPLRSLLQEEPSRRSDVMQPNP